jgi:hypothetical protein
MSSTRSCVTPAQASSLIPHTPVLLRHRARIVTTNGQQHVNSAAFCLDWQFMRMILRLVEYRFATSMLCLGVSDVKASWRYGFMHSKVCVLARACRITE